jgi:hypothetical protein
MNTANNPPLVNVTQGEAVTSCAARPGLSYTNITIGAVTLPEKFDYMAYSAPPLGMTDSNISDLEQGFSLDVNSRCNSSNADAISAGFTDSTIPSSSYMYAISGTASSLIRSLTTGSVES